MNGDQPPTLLIPTGGMVETAGSRLAFFADGQQGIVRVDGTPNGSTYVTIMRSSELSVCHGKLYFNGLDPILCFEPFVIDLGASSRVLGTGIGEGARVPTLAIADPVLGSTATLTLRGGVPNALVALQLSLGPPQIAPLAPYAWLYYGPILVPVSFATPTAGTWQLALPVPNDPGIDGLDVLLQAALLNTGSSAAFELTNAIHAMICN